MAGAEVGGISEIGGAWDRDRLVVGRVLKVDRHPNADRLTLPTIDLGDGETITVVCGAPNVAAGQKIAFAREGSSLYSARSGRVEELKATKIRGILSAGMVCSALELGLSDDHEGIVVLDDEAPVGTSLVDYLGDSILDIEVTPNRPDCLSILGVAHEVAALTGETVTEPDLSYPEGDLPIAERVNIEIADPDLCYRYAASVISGVTVGPSPAWLQDALVRAGQRPINNIVDVTNYVMLEYGQPLHAFDLDTLADSTVIVRAARPGEALETLDGERRILRPPMLTIADAHDPVALAGVMGGAKTGVGDGTTSILLESASFHAINTRRTAAALHITSEAAYRFERSIRAELVPRALRRATGLVLQVAGGEAARGIIDIYPGEKEPPSVEISMSRIKQVLGIDLPLDEIERVLSSLGFEREPGSRSAGESGTASDGGTEDALRMRAPYWRSDIAIEDDLVEEVARIVGYENIPTAMLSTPIPHHEPSPSRDFRERIRDLLAASGMQEVISYSLTDLGTLSSVDALTDASEPLRLANPMSSEMQHLRTSLRGSVLKTLASNQRVSQRRGLRLFEIGRVFLPREEAEEKVLPDEREMLVGVLSGPRFPTSWRAPEGDMGFFDAKGALESLFEQVGAPVEYEPSSDRIMRPGVAARLVSNGVTVGVVGEIHPRVLDRFDLVKTTAAIFEIDLESLYKATPRTAGRYAGVSRFPEAERDMALLVDDTVTSAAVQSIIQRHKLVKYSSPFDLYSGEGVPSGKKSIAYRIVFQSRKETLTAEQVGRAQQSILSQLQREVGAELRGPAEETP
jgi:phenylalanyl-tRNA synthetase beta chain